MTTTASKQAFVRRYLALPFRLQALVARRLGVDPNGHATDYAFDLAVAARGGANMAAWGAALDDAEADATLSAREGRG